MVTLKFEEYTTDEQLTELSALAYEIWREFFPAVISEGQIEYMLEKFQSFEAMKRQIAEENYRYFGVVIGGELIGYYAVSKKPDGSLFLSKLYLRKDMRGKGIASLMFKEIKRLARREGCELIWLTVNKGNAHAISVYKTLKMHLIREEQTDIGGGYIMDDYVFGIMV